MLPALGRAKDVFFGSFRGMYDWTLSWANTPYGTPALAAVAFAESSFFPIPPDLLLIALCVSIPRRCFYYVAVCSASSVLGGLFGYFIGLAMYDTVGRLIIQTLQYEAYFDLVGRMYADNAFLAIMAAAFTPIPYKVFTIAAGVWRIDVWTLLAASALGRTGRFLLVGTMIYVFGARIKTFIEKYFEAFSVAVFAIVAGGFLAVRYLL
jgi:membrane protein YqaA with SNARE-associated domain